MQTYIIFKAYNMKNKTVGKKGTISDGYQHPLIKNVAQILQEDQSIIIPSYQPYLPSHQNRTSSKLIRYTTLTPSHNSEMSLFLQPFHPTIHQLPELSLHLQCPSCQCHLNPSMTINNYTQLKCNICQQTNEIPAFNNQQYKANHAYSFINNSSLQKQRMVKFKNNIQTVQRNKECPRRVCFVLQISQFNYEYGIHNSIYNCVKALENDQLQVGFVFYHDKCIMFLDQNSMELVKVPIALGGSNPLQGWDSLPVSETDLFEHVSKIQQQVKTIIESIMYEGFYIKQTLLPQVTQLLSQYLPNTVQLKFFISTLNNLAQQNIQKQTSLIGMFKERQNTLSSLIDKKSSQAAAANNYKRQVKIGSNNHFFVILQNTTYKECMDILKYAVYKIYSVKQKLRLIQILYYDLFENIGYPLFIDTEIQIKTTAQLQLTFQNSESFNLYYNLSLVESVNLKYGYNYKLSIKQANQSTVIPLTFTVNADSNNSSQPFIQFNYKINKRKVILNTAPIQILRQGQIGIQWLDDEALFNYHLRKSISKWDGINYKKLKELLQQQYQYLIRIFTTNYRSNSINFPKNFKHYFLYIFLWQQKLNTGFMNSYQIFKMLKSNLQIHGKQLYFRTYRLDMNELKNIKSTQSIFQKYSILFMQNGEELYMVFNQPTVQQIKDIFGYFDSIASIANHHYELPDLPTNSAYRDAITSIRSSHQSNFLPLKIIDTESHLYDCLIAPYLYRKEDHIHFLKKAWKNV